MWVYDEGGLCMDIEMKVARDDKVEAGEQVMTEQFEEVFGWVFKNVDE